MLKSEIDKMTLCPVYQAGKSYYIEINEELYYFQYKWYKEKYYFDPNIWGVGIKASPLQQEVKKLIDRVEIYHD